MLESLTKNKYFARRIGFRGAKATKMKINIRLDLKYFNATRLCFFIRGDYPGRSVLKSTGLAGNVLPQPEQ